LQISRLRRDIAACHLDQCNSKVAALKVWPLKKQVTDDHGKNASLRPAWCKVGVENADEMTNRRRASNPTNWNWFFQLHTDFAKL
jgi:hypothetical protein